MGARRAKSSGSARRGGAAKKRVCELPGDASCELLRLMRENPLFEAQLATLHSFPLKALGTHWDGRVQELRTLIGIAMDSPEMRTLLIEGVAALASFDPKFEKELRKSLPKGKTKGQRPTPQHYDADVVRTYEILKALGQERQIRAFKGMAVEKTAEAHDLSVKRVEAILRRSKTPSA